MNTQTHKNPVLFIVALLAMVALISLACSFSGVGVNTISPLVDITITQDEFDQMSSKADVHASGHCDQLDKVSRIELHDGFIRFVGAKVQPDGSEVDGSFDLSLGAENDMLKARIVAVDIPGVALNDQCIVEANQELEDELSHLVTDPQGEVLFKEVAVEEGVLRMKVQVHINY